MGLIPAWSVQQVTTGRTIKKRVNKNIFLFFLIKILHKNEEQEPKLKFSQEVEKRQRLFLQFFGVLPKRYLSNRTKRRFLL